MEGTAADGTSSPALTTICRRDPERRMARFYHLAMQAVLALPPGANHSTQDGQTAADTLLARCEVTRNPLAQLATRWDLIREWGRIGSPGTVRADHHPDQDTASEAAATIERLKRRRGYR